MVAIAPPQTRYRLQTPDPARAHIWLVGTGGTGSFLALHIARLAYHVREKTGVSIPLVFVDPDTVEVKNIGRQNFAPAEVGRHKAQTLAWRYGAAFGLDIAARVERFRPRMIDNEWRRENRDDWVLLVGAVDNGAGRLSMHDIASKWNDIYWLDCGNHEHSGQVLVGNTVTVIEPEISPLGFCSNLPLPSVYHPELLAPEPVVDTPVSCADLALAEVQGLMVNQAMATYAAQYLYRLLVTRDLDIYATYVDLVSGSARSLPITKPDGAQ